MPTLPELDELLVALEAQNRIQRTARRSVLHCSPATNCTAWISLHCSRRSANRLLEGRYLATAGQPDRFVKGDKFRKFAQGLTLDHLFTSPNRHLARLHGRYVLRRKTTGELELDIIDGWQGDTARDTRTLSGGGFLVSLALALALSIWSATRHLLTLYSSTKFVIATPSAATINSSSMELRSR